MLVRSAHPPSISSLECFCLDYFFTQWYDCINKKTNPPPNSCGSQEQGPFFCLDFVLSHNPERCTNQSCVKEKALVLISILSGLCISWKIYLPARLSGRCAVYFPLKNGKPNISSWTPPPSNRNHNCFSFLLFLFLFFFSQRVFSFPNLYKGSTRKKIIFYQMQTGRKCQFSERIFQWKVAIFCQRHLYSLTNYTKMSHLRSCSTSLPPTLQLKTCRILNFVLFWNR